MNEKYKASRKGWINGYTTGISRGVGLALAMVAVFALLVILNPLNLEYVRPAVYAHDAPCELIGSGGGSLIYWCPSTYTVVLYWFFFGMSIMIYGIITAISMVVSFVALFNVRRVTYKADIIDAAHETLGLYKKDDEEKKEQ